MSQEPTVVEVVLHDNRVTGWEGAIQGRDLRDVLRRAQSEYPELGIRRSAENHSAIELAWRDWTIRLVDEHNRPIRADDTIYPTVILEAVKEGPNEGEVRQLLDFLELEHYDTARRRRSYRTESLRDYVRANVSWRRRVAPGAEWGLH